MNTEQINRFDELMREKLSSYETEPDMDLLVNIHARKNRFLRSRNLTRLIILLAILSAGLLAGYYFSNGQGSHAASEGEKTQGEIRPVEAPASGKQVSDGQINGASTTSKQGQNATYQTTASSSDLQSSVKSGKQHEDNNHVNAQQTQSTHTSSLNNTREGNTTTITTSAVTHAASSLNPTAPSDKQHNSKITGQDKKDDNKRSTSDKTEQPSDKKSGSDVCSAEIDYYTTYDNAYHFMAKSVAADTKLTWSFGDGQNSNEQSPKHTYLKSGQYAVTLTAVNTKTKCKAEAYKLVRVNKGVNLSASIINGTIFADAEYASKTRVDLMVYNNKTNSFDIEQSTYTNNKGFYEFVEIGAGTYLVKTSSYKNYEGAYYGNTTDKEIATNIVVFADDYKELRGYDIQLQGSKYLSSTNTNDNDTGAKWMLVLDENNNPIASVMVSQNGQVQNTSNIPNGKYNLLDPATGQINQSITIGGGGTTGSAGTQRSTVGTISMQTELTLMPNPAYDYVKISLSNAEATPVEVSIINNNGSVVKHFTLNNGADVNQIDINALSVGSYYVIVKQNGITTSSRLVKTADNR